ncbi:MAG: DUF1800 domain-containing protein [Acidobacteriota bacterium]
MKNLLDSKISGRWTTRRLAPVLVTVAAATLGLTLYAAKDDMQSRIDPAAFTRPLKGDQRLVHALNRLTFGPAPGDLEAAKQLGLDKWLDQQLHPEKIAENPEVAKRLQPLETLRMSSAEAAEKYDPPQQQLQQGQAALQQNRQQNAQQNRQQQQQTQQQLQQANQAKQAKQKGKQGDPRQQDRQMARLAAMEPTARRAAFAGQRPNQVLGYDLTEAKLYRAVYSNHQLEEQMVDFWFNHFNVDISKGADRVLTTAYERDAIRPHVFGHFRDLLQATAESPAMLFYLDNWQSAAPNEQGNQQANQRGKQGALRAALQQKAKGKQQARGINENYARELMELHTLGVDNENQPGGYTQQDIINVAKAFTGWTIQQPRQGGQFVFNDRMHDHGEKIVLGVKIAAGGGKGDAEKVLDILAKHPATAHFVSLKLARRFVADDPPEALVERMAKRFRETDGDIREVVKAMVTSPEFFSEGAWRAKVKTPLELVVSAARATGANVGFAMPISTRLVDLGEPLYRKSEPTGYSTNAAEWVNSAALLARMNFALDLTANRLPGSTVDIGKISSDAQDMSVLLPITARRLLGSDPSPQTIASINKALADKTPTPELVAGLVLGSPDFQRR